MDKTINRVETIRNGVQGDRPLTEKSALMEAREGFIKLFGVYPTQLRLSPKCFNDLGAFAERWEFPFGFDVKVDYEFEEDQWIVCNETTKVWAIES